MNLQQPVTVTGLGMINGYAKIDSHDGTDRYAQERRITSVTYSLDGGQTFEQMLSDGVRSLQMMSIPPTSTTTVTITIDSTTAPGDAKHDYTAASEIQILGQ